MADSDKVIQFDKEIEAITARLGRIDDESLKAILSQRLKDASAKKAEHVIRIMDAAENVKEGIKTELNEFRDAATIKAKKLKALQQAITNFEGVAPDGCAAPTDAALKGDVKAFKEALAKENVQI